ncbi:MAG: HAMP domain-containing histidine kinase, partial [Clostridia bacterium]|nr:HAMP domain-containing histidine kinase [Clostridia bacterium]
DLPGEDSAENIQVVIDEADRLTALVNDVLDYSKMKAGVQTFDRLPVDMTALLMRTVERCRTMVQAEEYAIELICEGEAVVNGDELRLGQVIYNLLGNALAHTGEDMTVTIRQTVCADRVRVTVTDSGSGIPPEELPHIWRRYYQTKSAHRRRPKLGTGIGLSIVRMVVEQHGGTCGVESCVGVGSSFWFELPRI